VNPIVLGPDGALYVSRFYVGQGLYRIDPATGAVSTLSPDVSINAFAFGPDGAIYGQTMTVPSRLLRVDPATWSPTTVAPNVGLQGASTRFPGAVRREAPTTAYVLSPVPATIQRFDVTTGRRVGADIRLPQLGGDNMAFAPDGRVFVTAQTPATVGVVDLDGRTRSLAIGTG